MQFERSDFRYTPLFCEENIWWLAHDLVCRGLAVADCRVLVFCNPTQSVLMLNQRAAPPDRPVAWDYHVVLLAEIDNVVQVFDFDSRLAFPVPLAEYLAASFPPQAALPSSYQARVRLIPAVDFLARFSSDRSHMVGRVPRSAFPDYPVIEPAPDVPPITLARLRDMRAELDDGSRVLPLRDLLDAGLTPTA